MCVVQYKKRDPPSPHFTSPADLGESISIHGALMLPLLLLLRSFCSPRPAFCHTCSFIGHMGIEGGEGCKRRALLVVLVEGAFIAVSGAVMKWM